MHKKLFLSGLIMAVWLMGTGYAFWWFQTRDLRPFDLQAANLIEEQDLTQSFNSLIATLPSKLNTSYFLHFWQPDCSCNRFNRSHVNDIAAKYREKDFQLITIVRPHPDYNNQQLINMAKDEFDSIVLIDKSQQFSGKARIPAAPAAAVIDKQGKLAYFGPYSDSTFCGLGGTDFVGRVANLLVKGEKPSIINTMVLGCFCNWDSSNLKNI